MIAETVRPELEATPGRMRHLQIHRGYPVPWFVALVDGVPEFRCMDGEKFRKAIREKLCWVCGCKLGKFVTFVAGPMCGINRTSAEPPCHQECAQWSARNCPFLSKPQMVRRENDMPDGVQDAAGFAIRRNPGVTLLWTTKSYTLFGDGMGGVLLRMGDPESIEWLAMGKPATRQQVEESVAGGLPKLEAIAGLEEGGLAALTAAAERFKNLYPKETP